MTAQSVVVVGGGMAGFSALSELRAKGFEGSLTLVEAGGMPYDRPPLSKDFLLGDKDATALHFADEAWYRDRSIELVLGRRAVALDADAGAVTLDDGTVVTADVILLATGGTPRALPVPGGDLGGVFVLRDLEDAEKLKNVMSDGARVAVVGAGLIGAEAAASLKHLGAEVTIVDPVELPLAPVIGDELATLLHSAHEAHGVRVVASGVDGIERTDAGGLRVHLSNGDAVEADLVLVGIGIVPSVGLAEAAGLEVANGVVVDRFQRTSHPRVFAAGDSSRRRDAARRAEHWEAAQFSGKVAAAGILGIEPPAEDAEWFWSDRYDLHLECVGTLVGPGDIVVRGSEGELPIAVFRIVDGLLVGAASVNDSMAVRAARRLMAGAVPVNAEELADTSVNLRNLLKAHR